MDQDQEVRDAVDNAIQDGNDPVNTLAVTPAEEAAMARGWVKKDEWKGDPEEWRPAKEFLDRGELIGKIMAQGRELDQLKAAVQHMTVQQQKAYLAGFENAKRQVLQARDAALEEGDLKRAQQLNDKLDDIKDQAKEARQEVRQVQQTGPSDTYRNWTQSNPWYGQDRTLTLYADSVGVAFKESSPGSSELEMLEHVAKEVKKEFEHRFKKQSAPNPDGEGRHRNVQQSKSGNAKEDSMTAQDKQIMNTILKTTKMTKEQYLKDFNR